MRRVVLSHGQGPWPDNICLALGVKVGVWRVTMSTGKESVGHEESLEKKR